MRESPAVARSYSDMTNTHKPSISVVVAAYQAERFIAEALESILNQTHAPDEVIVVNDGSTDGTARELERFADKIRPQLVLLSAGFDSHRLDPLAHLSLSVDGQRQAQVMMHELAHELCDGRWIATGGGGYALVQVVPRTWTHLLAVAAGAPIDPEAAIPAAWRELATSLTGESAPRTMTDGAAPRYASFASGADPGDPVDRAIMRTRTAVFPSHGLPVM